MSSKLPNVLYILTDDQRFDTIAALGASGLHTPHLDRLVRRGTTFTNAYIMGGSVAAVCMPSRAMIHTGRPLYHLQGEGQSIAREHKLLAEHFREAGYQTFGCGKWHNGEDAFARSFTDGSEIFFGGMADHWNVPAFGFDPTGRYDARLPVCPDPGASNEVRLRPADHIHAGKHSTDILAHAATTFIRERDRDRPFFAYVSFLAPHDPRTMPPEFRSRYDPDCIELPPNFAPEHPFDNGWLDVRDERLALHPRTPEAIRQHLADYYAMISHLDARIGDILDTLEASGDHEDTVIVLAGDNGLALGQHGLMGKQSCYDHSLHVPLLFAGPGVPAGERSDELCYLFDIYPTLCQLAGLDIPASVLGTPLLGGTAQPRDHLFHAFTHTHRALRCQRWKLIETAAAGDHVIQLFDLLADPFETTNLADDPAAASELVHLRQRLRQVAAQNEDDGPGQGRTFWANAPLDRQAT